MAAPAMPWLGLNHSRARFSAHNTALGPVIYEDGADGTSICILRVQMQLFMGFSVSRSGNPI
jgi:hypothetical protein